VVNDDGLGCGAVELVCRPKGLLSKGDQGTRRPGCGLDH
jgi:hypothetical protein